MKLRTLALTTVAGLIIAVPLSASAYDYHPSYYNTNPTPEERAQTDSLNQDADRAAAGTISPNDQADYDRQRADYDRNMQDYAAQRAAYSREMARYNYALRWDAFYGSPRFREVVLMPSNDVIGASVRTRNGVYVGRVRDVDYDNGRIERVAVRMNGGGVAWIDADFFRFDRDGDTLVTNLSYNDMRDMTRFRYPRF